MPGREDHPLKGGQRTVDCADGVVSIPEISVVVYHRDGAEIVPLVPGARLLIGRSDEAVIAIPEATLSRQHAVIELLDGEIWIEDLGSSNGTRVNGQRVRRQRLTAGDDITLGDVYVSIHTTGQYTTGLEHHSQFIASLTEEMTRSETFGHQLAVVLVRDEQPQGDATKLATAVRQLLRPVDRVSQQGTGVLEVLLPESTRAEALQQVARYQVACGELRCGIALYPGAGESPESLLEAAERALSRASAERPMVVEPSEQTPARPREETPLAPGGRAMESVYRTIQRVAPADLPVLICGETGSGKEVVARAIHDSGPRRDREMRCINCGALPRELIQSILFGHVRGSFTGASRESAGVFEQADRSTLLLDEVGELPAEAQVALLRVLETGRVNRIGSSREIPVDVRVVAATHRDLEAMCEAGTFRWDLYYRLNTITLRVPPLRERLDELRGLAEHFVERACQLSGVPVKPIDEDTLQLMRGYRWLGNVRELRNAMERAVLVSTGLSIAPDDLPDRVRGAGGTSVGAAPRKVRDDTPIFGLRAVEDFRTRVRAYETMLIRRALLRTGWNKTAAAHQLQMPLRTLINKVQSYGLTPEPPAEGEFDDIATPVGQPTLDFRSRIQRYETTMLRDALDASEWNKAEAARQLGLPLSTMLYKIRSYQLEQA